MAGLADYVQNALGNGTSIYGATPPGVLLAGALPSVAAPSGAAAAVSPGNSVAPLPATPTFSGRGATPAPQPTMGQAALAAVTAKYNDEGPPVAAPMRSRTGALIGGSTNVRNIGALASLAAPPVVPTIDGTMTPQVAATTAVDAAHAVNANAGVVRQGGEQFGPVSKRAAQSDAILANIDANNPGIDDNKRAYLYRAFTAGTPLELKLGPDAAPAAAAAPKAVSLPVLQAAYAVAHQQLVDQPTKDLLQTTNNQVAFWADQVAKKKLSSEDFIKNITLAAQRNRNLTNPAIAQPYASGSE